MKLLPALGLLLALAGCAQTGAPRLEETILTPSQMNSGFLEIRLDGVTYSGTWQGAACFTAHCRGKFWNLPRHERRHVQQGKATLQSAAGNTLTCAWVSYRDRLDGTCETPDGRQYKLAVN